MQPKWCFEQTGSIATANKEQSVPIHCGRGESANISYISSKLEIPCALEWKELIITADSTNGNVANRHFESRKRLTTHNKLFQLGRAFFYDSYRTLFYFENSVALKSEDAATCIDEVVVTRMSKFCSSLTTSAAIFQQHQSNVVIKDCSGVTICDSGFNIFNAQ